MADKRTYVPFTTASQRRLLFSIWEATGGVSEACRRGHVGRRTFYYWKPAGNVVSTHHGPRLDRVE